MQESVKGDRLLEVMKRSRTIIPGGEENCGAHPNINGTLPFSLPCTHFWVITLGEFLVCEGTVMCTFPNKYNLFYNRQAIVNDGETRGVLGLWSSIVLLVN